MKYKLIGNNDYLVDPLGTVLKNRGIENIDKFLNPDRSCLNDWRLLDNIERAVDTIIKHFENQAKIKIFVDP